MAFRLWGDQQLCPHRAVGPRLLSQPELGEASPWEVGVMWSMSRLSERSRSPGSSKKDWKWLSEALVSPKGSAQETAGCLRGWSDCQHCQHLSCPPTSQKLKTDCGSLMADEETVKVPGAHLKGCCGQEVGQYEHQGE